MSSHAGISINASWDTADHRKRVALVSESIKSRPRGQRIVIKKDTPTHTIIDRSYKDSGHSVDVSSLCKVLFVDRENQVAFVEGQVTVFQLCQATLAVGLAPKVVPEWRDFTVSGLLNGSGIQTTSHKYGVFPSTVLAAELIPGNGQVIFATRDNEHAELLSLMNSSKGTIAIVASLAISLIPAKPFVRSVYHGFTDMDQYLSALKAAIGQQTFLDGIVYAKDRFVMITSEFTDSPGDLPIFDPWDSKREGLEWYYQYAERVAFQHTATPYQDAIATLPFFSRSQRGAWWVLEMFAGTPLLSRTRFGRKLLDRKVEEASVEGLKVRGLTVTERERSIVNQDIGVTLDRLKEGIVFSIDRLGLFPIWNGVIRCSPEEAARVPSLAGNLSGDQYLVDIGLWGEPKAKGFRNMRDIHAVQKFLGYPSVWGVCYLTRDELRQLYPCQKYNQVRKALGSDQAFHHIEDKVIFLQQDPSLGPVPCWRLYRAFKAGEYSPVLVVFSVWFVALIVVLFAVKHIGKLVAPDLFSL